MKYFLILLLLTSFTYSNNYSKNGEYKRWMIKNKYKIKQKMMRNENYNTFDHLYVHYAKIWNKKWSNERNPKYKGIYITPYILKALAWKESRWRAHINNRGLNKNGSVDYGLTQINNRTDRKYFKRANVRPIQVDLYDAKKNIMMAMYIFDYHARAQIRNGRNNPRDKMIYWLNSYNGKATYNPTAYGESILYMANVLKKMHGINEYVSMGQDNTVINTNTSVNDSVDDLYHNIDYPSSTKTVPLPSKITQHKRRGLYGDLYPYKPYMGL